ncbi:hypothetical protein ACPEIF_23605 [Streptomyces sp. NPDC012600]|uniref:hypothetical protein n=1 Tax=Streptomyces sp. NPDC012600 TaxID=3415005 RepID=UPI003C300BE1
MGLLRLLTEGPAPEILTDADHQAGRAVGAPDWYEDMHKRSTKRSPHDASGSSPVLPA